MKKINYFVLTLLFSVTLPSATLAASFQAHFQCLQEFVAKNIERRIPTYALALGKVNDETVAISELKTKKSVNVTLADELVAGDDRYWHISAADKVRIGAGLMGTTSLVSEKKVVKLAYNPIEKFSPGAMVAGSFMNSDTPTAVGDSPNKFSLHN